MKLIVILDSQAKNYEPIVKNMLNTSNFNFSYKDPITNDTYLHRKFGIYVNRLILTNYSHKIDINSINSKGETSLHQYCELDEPFMIELLLKNHAKVNVKRNDGEFPLSILLLNNYFSFCRISSPKSLKLLIDYKANVNSKVPVMYDLYSNKSLTEKESIFIRTIKLTTKYVDPVSILLSAGANPLTLIKKSSTLSFHKKLQINKEILPFSATPEVKKELFQILKYSVERVLNDVQLLHNAIEKNDRNEVMRLLTREGINPNLNAPITEDTSLHKAILLNNFEIMELLLLYNGDVSAVNFDRFTVIELAIKCEAFHSLCAILSFSNIPIQLVKHCFNLLKTKKKKSEIEIKMENILENYIFQRRDMDFDTNSSDLNELIDDFEIVSSDSDEILDLITTCNMNDWDEKSVFNLASKLMNSKQEHFPQPHLINWKAFIRDPLENGNFYTWMKDDFATQCFHCASPFKIYFRKVNILLFFFIFIVKHVTHIHTKFSIIVEFVGLFIVVLVLLFVKLKT